MVGDWNIQEHLVQMEQRLSDKIDAVHEDVQANNQRIVVLEKDTVKVKTLWRSLVACVTLLFGWAVAQIVAWTS